MSKLRGNFGKNQFFIFDSGINAKEVKPGQKLAVGQHIRRQQGTILYSNKRPNGQKVDRNIEMYIPEPAPAENDQLKTWFDNVKKKDKIHNEFKQYSSNKGKVSVSMDASAQSDDPQAQAQHTDGIKMYHSLDMNEFINFQGRVAKASKKNLQMIDQDD